MLEVCYMYNNSSDNECPSHMSIAAIVVGVLAAILLILLGVAITGWVCTYSILKKKLKQSVKTNSR